MKKAKITGLCISFLCILILVSDSPSQEWQKIVPIESTCEEVRKLLKADECKIPVKTYKFPDLWININFSEGDNDLNISRGTVTRVLVVFLKSLTLEEFEEILKNLEVSIKDFEIHPDDDLIDSKIFKSESKGINFTVRAHNTDVDGGKELYVSSVVLYPPQCKNIK